MFKVWVCLPFFHLRYDLGLGFSLLLYCRFGIGQLSVEAFDSREERIDRFGIGVASIVTSVVKFGAFF